MSHDAAKAAHALIASVDVLSCAVENLALSSSDNTQAVVCLEDLRSIAGMLSHPSSRRDLEWALRLFAATLERLSGYISAQSQRCGAATTE